MKVRVRVHGQPKGGVQEASERISPCIFRRSTGEKVQNIFVIFDEFFVKAKNRHR